MLFFAFTPSRIMVSFIKSALLIFILVLSFFVVCTEAEENNYCTDPNSWQEWDDLSNKYPDDMDIQTLHALRLGLCAKVQRGDITVQQATDIFEKARSTILNKMKAQSLKEEGGI